MRELWRGRRERSAVFAVIAALIKPQLAILVPIVAVGRDPAGAVAEGRLRRRGRAAPARVLAGSTVTGWLRILTTAAAGFVTAVAAVGAVRADRDRGLVDRALPRVAPAADRSDRGGYPYLTVNAYNSWALFPVDGQSVATAGGALWVPDSPATGRGGLGCDRADPGARGGRGPAPGHGCGRSPGGRPPPGPAHDPGRRLRARVRLLRRPDPRPRAVPVPVLRPGGDPGRLLLALADRLRRGRRSRRS